MPEKDAILLFRIIAKERNAVDLLKLSDKAISTLVKRVKCYPLLIKWAIGQVCLGKEINRAFSQIFIGESEIAKFVFTDVFALISNNSKNILYSMIVYGDKAVSRFVLMHLSNLNDDQFEDAIKELTLTSFVFPESKETDSGTITEYKMLELTRGFIEAKLDTDERTRQMLVTRLYHLSAQIQDFEKAKSSYFQSLFSLGIKTPEEQVAFSYVKAAKNFAFNGEIENAEKNFEQAAKIAPKLSYVLTEYSKFEYTRKHFAEALILAERAVNANPNNFHAWFNYGLILQKMRKSIDAIKAFQKGKELNPKYLPLFTELGRAYGFNGEYDKAETEFVEALKEEQYPNYRHKMITLQSSAENYRRWAEAFRDRHDIDGHVEMLQKALDSISKAADIFPNDRMVRRTYYKIYVDLGIAYTQKFDFNYGKQYLEKCLQPIKVRIGQILPDDEMVSIAYFYLAALGINNGVKSEQLINWINKGISVCTDGRTLSKLKVLKNQIPEYDSIKQSSVEEGIIKFFNTFRKFGIIISKSGKTYLFLIDGFRDRKSTNELYNLAGKKVTYTLIENKERPNGVLAADIIILL